jgi:hypothetical protein
MVSIRYRTTMTKPPLKTPSESQKPKWGEFGISMPTILEVTLFVLHPILETRATPAEAVEPEPTQGMKSASHPAFSNLPRIASH